MSEPHVISPDQLLEHWQGHRRLTRRVLEAFPEEQLWSFSVGGMRPFGALVMEMLMIGAPMLKGIVTGDWVGSSAEGQPTKAELLALWDADTATLDAFFPQIPLERFQEHRVAFGQYPGSVYYLLLYGIDNEIHHRAQGYVYLRALGIEPPPFFER
ncbi:MAG: damage-inducible protein DinB [Gemmatimonadetes bacterium]|nr:damage-inducible protein DinB [Gemmatimonadota bacterium]